jgi:hypothetical protein
MAAYGPEYEVGVIGIARGCGCSVRTIGCGKIVAPVAGRAAGMLVVGVKVVEVAEGEFGTEVGKVVGPAEPAGNPPLGEVFAGKDVEVEFDAAGAAPDFVVSSIGRGLR